MKNKYLFGLLGLLGFSSCSSDPAEEPCYYGPGPIWGKTLLYFPSKVVNEQNEPINGIQVIASFEDSSDNNKIVADTTYTKKQDISSVIFSGAAINYLNFDTKTLDVRKLKVTLKYIDVDSYVNGRYESKTIVVTQESTINEVTLLKKETKEE